LLEAAAILCRREMQLYRKGGEALAAAILHSVDEQNPSARQVAFLIRGDEWLATRLLAALCKRADLQLTGHNIGKGADPERYRLPHYLLLAAVKSDKKDFSMRYRPWLRLDIERGTARIGFEPIQYEDPDVTHHHPETVELIAVRIEASADATMALRRPATTAGKAEKRVQDIKEWKVWYHQRITAWPRGKPAPTFDQDHAAAIEHFGVAIPRREFRKIRLEVAPPEALKPGPRGPRE
jgi:hypothetical protein